MRVPHNHVARELNRAVLAYTEASAELWVLSSRALGELSLNLTESVFPLEQRDRSATTKPVEKREPDAPEVFGRALYDIGSAIFRATNQGSELLRRTLTRFYDRWSA
jgi:hypothetical protein